MPAFLLLWLLFHAVLFSAESPPVYAVSRILGNIQPRQAEAPQIWGSRVVQQYLFQDVLPEEDFLELRFPLSYWRYYLALQMELAKHFPEESSRPRILLSLRNSLRVPEKIIGVVGGLGPLADARLLELAMSELEAAYWAIPSVELRINSDPHPPRTFLASLNLSTWSYLLDIVNFLRQEDVHEFVLGSNTAH